MSKENTLYLACGLILGTIFGALALGPRLHQLRISSAETITQPMQAEMPAASPPASEQAIMQMILRDIEQLKVKVASDPNDVESLVALGNLYMDARQYDNAREHFERSLAIRPDPDVSTDLALCHRALGDVDTALRMFRDVQKAHPSHWPSMFNEAVVLFVDLRRPDDARALISRMKSIRPDDPDLQRLEAAVNQPRS